VCRPRHPPPRDSTRERVFYARTCSGSDSAIGRFSGTFDTGGTHAIRRARTKQIVGIGHQGHGFNRPGIGFLILNAIESRNYPVVQGGLIVAVFLYALANLLADLSYGFIDPRIRTE
jgi:hypothetical protein